MGGDGLALFASMILGALAGLFKIFWSVFRFFWAEVIRPLRRMIWRRAVKPALRGGYDALQGKPATPPTQATENKSG